MTAVKDALRRCEALLAQMTPHVFLVDGTQVATHAIWGEVRAALAEAEKGESELVAALEYIAERQDGVSRGTAWDQLVDVREAARAALSKHATPEHAKKG